MADFQLVRFSIAIHVHVHDFDPDLAQFVIFFEISRN